MIKTSIKPYNLILFILLFLSILPTINIGAFSMPVLYLLTPIGAVLLLFILFGWIKIPRVLKSIILFFLLILIGVFISSMYGSVTYLGRFIFPTDSMQYITRLLTLVSFIVIFYKEKVDADTFIKFFLIMLNIGMLIGILQWLPWSGGDFFITLYPFRDGLEQLARLDIPLHLQRVHGFAQHATANGGLATYFFVFGYAIFKYYKKYYFLSIFLMFFSIVNVVISQARAGLLALVFSFFLFYIIDIHINRKSLKPTFLIILTISGISFVFWQLYNNGNVFIIQMLYRWNALFNTSGGGRIDQLMYFFTLISDKFQYLFGLSKPVINQSAIPYGIEIEPVNIFITYGIVGFILHYFLVAILLIYFLKNIRKSLNNKASLTLLVASFVGLFSYQVFSIAYFFFREIRIGLFPWILMGVAIGVYELYKIKSRGKINGV